MDVPCHTSYLPTVMCNSWCGGGGGGKCADAGCMLMDILQSAGPVQFLHPQANDPEQLLNVRAGRRQRTLNRGRQLWKDISAQAVG